jgi:3-hexulose-6-phosphate synthase/6-phospho-3-hexuloisomerase
MEPILQVALDFLELKRALKAAREAVEGGASWIEAGTPLVKSAGLDAVRALRREFPKHYLVADLKTMDAGRIEVEAAAKAGANCATVLGAGSDATILEAIEAGRNYGIDISVDLLAVADVVGLSRRCQEWGAHHVSLHLPIDEQMRGGDALRPLRELRPHVRLPVAIAGGINSETAAEVVLAGADIVIVGGAITKATDARAAAAAILRAMMERRPVATTLFKRGGPDEIRQILRQVSSPNVSDAMHRSGDLAGVRPIQQGAKFLGPAVTVRTAPGDWAKPVEAIDLCRPGDVLVIDAGGLPPAVWGELASESCLQRQVAGVVIHGAIRDVDAIRAIGFPACATIVTPTAGEPKGFGETNVTLKIGGVPIAPGDWILADDSGVVVIPQARAAEVANRAMDVLEKENRLRQEIRQQSSLGQVAELAKWEKRIVESADPDR